ALERATRYRRERRQVGAVVRERHPLRGDAEAAVRVDGPATAADPVIGGSAGRHVEGTEQSVLQVQNAGHLEDARDGMVARERETCNEGRAHEMAVDDVRADSLDETSAANNRGRQLPRRVDSEVELHLDHSDAQFW